MSNVRLCTLSGVFAFIGLIGCGSQPATEAGSPAEVRFTGAVDIDHATIDEAIAAGPFAADWDSLAGN